MGYIKEYREPTLLGGGLGHVWADQANAASTNYHYAKLVALPDVAVLQTVTVTYTDVRTNQTHTVAMTASFEIVGEFKDVSVSSSGKVICYIGRKL